MIGHEPQPLSIGNHMLGAFLISGKVSHSAAKVECHLSFDLHILQQGMVNHQTVHILCYYPLCLLSLILGDMSLSKEQPITEAPAKSTHFDWYSKGIS